MHIEIKNVWTTINDIIVDYDLNHVNNTIKVEHSDFKKYLEDEGLLSCIADTCRNGEHNQREIEISYTDFILNSHRQKKAMKYYLEEVVYAVHSLIIETV